MSCATCAYYAPELQCLVHGKLTDVGAWLLCPDYLDRDAQYWGNVVGGCGIYNYPWPDPALAPRDAARRTTA